MSNDDPLAITPWDVKRLYSDGFPDRAAQVARYLRATRENGIGPSVTAADWISCPCCGSDEADVYAGGGGGTCVIECLRCGETAPLTE